MLTSHSEDNLKSEHVVNLLSHIASYNDFPQLGHYSLSILHQRLVVGDDVSGSGTAVASEIIEAGGFDVLLNALLNFLRQFQRNDDGNDYDTTEGEEEKENVQMILIRVLDTLLTSDGNEEKLATCVASYLDEILKLVCHLWRNLPGHVTGDDDCCELKHLQSNISNDGSNIGQICTSALKRSYVDLLRVMVRVVQRWRRSNGDSCNSLDISTEHSRKYFQLDDKPLEVISNLFNRERFFFDHGDVADCFLDILDDLSLLNVSRMLENGLNEVLLILANLLHRALLDFLYLCELISCGYDDFLIRRSRLEAFIACRLLKMFHSCIGEIQNVPDEIGLATSHKVAVALLELQLLGEKRISSLVMCTFPFNSIQKNFMSEFKREAYQRNPFMPILGNFLKELEVAMATKNGMNKNLSKDCVKPFVRILKLEVSLEMMESITRLISFALIRHSCTMEFITCGGMQVYQKLLTSGNVSKVSLMHINLSVLYILKAQDQIKEFIESGSILVLMRATRAIYDKNRPRATILSLQCLNDTIDMTSGVHDEFVLCLEQVIDLYIEAHVVVDKAAALLLKLCLLSEDGPGYKSLIVKTNILSNIIKNVQCREGSSFTSVLACLQLLLSCAMTHSKTIEQIKMVGGFTSVSKISLRYSQSPNISFITFKLSEILCDYEFLENMINTFRTFSLSDYSEAVHGWLISLKGLSWNKGKMRIFVSLGGMYSFFGLLERMALLSKTDTCAVELCRSMCDTLYQILHNNMAFEFDAIFVLKSLRTILDSVICDCHLTSLACSVSSYIRQKHGWIDWTVVDIYGTLLHCMRKCEEEPIAIFEVLQFLSVVIADGAILHLSHNLPLVECIALFCVKTCSSKKFRRSFGLSVHIVADIGRSAKIREVLVKHQVDRCIVRAIRSGNDLYTEYDGYLLSLRLLVSRKECIETYEKFKTFRQLCPRSSVDNQEKCIPILETMGTVILSGHLNDDMAREFILFLVHSVNDVSNESVTEKRVYMKIIELISLSTFHYPTTVEDLLQKPDIILFFNFLRDHFTLPLLEFVLNLSRIQKVKDTFIDLDFVSLIEAFLKKVSLTDKSRVLACFYKNKHSFFVKRINLSNQPNLY